ncbi:MAG: hypothetical protein U0V56_02295 [Actinomycetota bacterium]
MKVEFHLPDAPDEVLVTAAWRDGEVEVTSEDETRRARVEKAYRRTPASVDDGAYRRLGTSGEVVIAPGSLEWFRAVTQSRAQSETGLVSRTVPDVRRGAGFDPAAGYRPFEEQVERISA